MKSFFATIATLALILTAGISSAQEPASTPKPRCATAKSTEITQTADGRTVIRVKSVQVCK